MGTPGAIGAGLVFAVACAYVGGAPQAPLALVATVTTTGAGGVRADGVDCRGTCRYRVAAGEELWLEAVPDGAVGPIGFRGFRGACGTDLECRFTPGVDLALAAEFVPPPPIKADWVTPLFGTGGYASAGALAVDLAHDAVYVAGDFEGIMSAGTAIEASAGRDDAYTMRLDRATGAVRWLATLGTAKGLETATAVAAVGDHAVIAIDDCAAIAAAKTARGGCLVELDPGGQPVQYGGGEVGLGDLRLASSWAGQAYAASDTELYDLAPGLAITEAQVLGEPLVTLVDHGDAAYLVTLLGRIVGLGSGNPLSSPASEAMRAIAAAASADGLALLAESMDRSHAGALVLFDRKTLAPRHTVRFTGASLNLIGVVHHGAWIVAGTTEGEIAIDGRTFVVGKEAFLVAFDDDGAVQWLLPFAGNVDDLAPAGPHEADGFLVTGELWKSNQVGSFFVPTAGRVQNVSFVARVRDPGVR